MPANKEAKTAKILFWCISPLLFFAFIRLFFLIFRYVFGTPIIQLIGVEYKSLIILIATLTSIGVTIAVIVYLYRQYKRHILGEK